MGNLQGRHKKSKKPVGTQPADDAGTSTRPSTSQIPQTSGVTSREEVGTQPADDAGTSTRPSTSQIPQTSGVTSREEVGTQPADDAGTSTRPSTSQIPQTSGVTSREEVGTQPADDAGTSTRPSTSQIPQTSGVTSREEVDIQPADDAGTSTRPSTSHGVGVSEDAPICYLQRSGASIGSIGTISGSQIPIIVGSSRVHVTYLSPLEVPGCGQQPKTAPQRIGLNPQNAGTGTWDLNSCQGQLKKTYKKRDSISKHPTCTNDPLHHVEVDELYTELLLCQDDYTEVLKETLGKFQIDKAKTKPLDSFEDFLNAEKVKESLVILSGGAGHGKSTIFKKIVDTWAKRDLFSNFRLLFFLEIKHMKNPCVIDEVLNQCFPRDKRPDRDDLIRIITDNQKESVFVLDGLDELRPGLLEPNENSTFCLYNVLHNKVLQDSRVLVATRPHMVQDLWKDNQKYALVHTSGFTSENTYQYIRKHFTDDRKTKADGLIECLQGKEMLKNIARIPLLCQIMCAVFSNDDKLSDRLATLYKSFTEVLAKRRCQKNDNWEKKLDSELKYIGKAAFKAMIAGENELVFESDYRESVLHTRASGESGFIQLESHTCGLGEKTIVMFLHKTFQEYSAAYYFAHLYDCHKRIFKHWLKKINPDNVNAMEYMLRFTCGILSGSPATALILKHVQTQCFERRLSADNYKLQQLLLFESGWIELADKLDRPILVDCFSQEHLLAMRYYLQCLRQPLVELEHLSVHCRSHEELASLRGIDGLLHYNTVVSIYFSITGRLHECLKLLGEILPIDKIRSIQKFGLHFEFIVSEKKDEERQTPVEEYEWFRDDILFLRLHIQEKSHVDEHVLESLSCFRKQVRFVALRRRTYDDSIRLANALDGCNRLAEVYVGHTNLHGHLAGVAPLVSPSLRSLTLESCGLNDDDIHDLISILPAGHGLMALYIQFNAFSVVRLETLKAQLRNRLPKLRHIYALQTVQ